jgi:hypothetical protein
MALGFSKRETVMGNLIIKAVNTVAAKSKAESLVSSFFKKCSLGYFQKKFYEGFKEEHYNAVKDIIHVFVNLGINHVILKAPTQSGKTTVMTLLYNVVNESESFFGNKKYLGVKRVIYLTGDNQCELSEQSMDRFCYQCHLPEPPIRLSGSSRCKVDEFNPLLKEWTKSGKTPFIMVKNGDCKAFREKIDDFTLNNTLIMVDESHYGTQKINSQVNKFLQEFGNDFSGDPKKLKKNNTYILSVSATPYNEEYADNVNNNGDLLKGVVHYKAGKGYIGFSYFYNKGIIEGLKNNSCVTEKAIFLKFLKEQREKMDNIYNQTQKRHAVIMRMQGKTNTLLVELGKKGLSDILNKYGFKLMIVDSKNSAKDKIDYDNAYKAITCSQYEGGKNVFIIVIQGFSYGISIPDNVKPLISTIFDFRPTYSTSTTDSTEQGLLGRMTGYHPNGLSKYLKIYIAEDHLNGLYNYHMVLPPAEAPNPANKKAEKVKCTFEEWNNAKYANEDEKNKHIVIWNNEDYQPLIYNGKIVDDFFKKHPEFDYKKLFSKDVQKDTTNFLFDIIKVFNKEVLKGKFNLNLLADTRRQKGTSSVNDRIAKDLGYGRMLSSYSRVKWRKVENVGKVGWDFVIDLTKRKGKTNIEIRIPYGEIGFAKSSSTNKKRKNYNGYQKSEFALATAKV